MGRTVYTVITTNESGEKEVRNYGSIKALYRKHKGEICMCISKFQKKGVSKGHTFINDVIEIYKTELEHTGGRKKDK